MSGAPETKSTKSRPPVTLTGTAKLAAYAPPLGLVDIGESPRAYIFRVSLPGVCKPQSNLKLDIRNDGRVEIEGIIQESEFLNNHSANKYKPKLQQLPPSGSFHVIFNLPGRVDPRLVSPTFRNTGILEVVVMKHTTPYNQPATPVPLPPSSLSPFYFSGSILSQPCIFKEPDLVISYRSL